MGWVVNALPRLLYLWERYPVHETGWAPGPVWTGAKKLSTPGTDARTVQRVASRYTDYAIPGHEDFGKPDDNSSNRLSRYPVTSLTEKHETN